MWAAQQPLDKRVFGSRHDDVELLGKLATRGGGWPGVGLAIHLANGAAFGAVYALVRPFAPGPATATGAGAALAEHLATWPLTTFVDRYHPARKELERSFEDMNREINHLIEQLTDDERRAYLAESLFLNQVKYENDKLESYLRKLGKAEG